MTQRLREAGSLSVDDSDSAEKWSTLAQTAMDRVVRRSVEMRLVATLIVD